MSVILTKSCLCEFHISIVPSAWYSFMKSDENPESVELPRVSNKERNDAPSPAEEGEGDGKNKGLETDACVEVVEGGIVSVAVAGLGDGEPSILGVKLRQVAHLFKVSLQVHQHTLHWRPH